MTVHYQVHTDVAVLTLDLPPVNSLGLAMRQALAAGLQRAQDEPQVQAIVLTGAGKAFSGGADISEFGHDAAFAEPNLHTLIAMVEGCSKPVVAALHSVCMGGGLELSLACHYRMATPDCKLGLPEVKLGLLPGAGGTQRLPRALGVEPALNMIVSGEPVAAALLAQVPGQKLLTQLATSAATLLDEAVALARSVASVRPLPLVAALRARHPQGDAYFQFARNMVKGMAKHFPAPAKCVDAVQAATQQKITDGLATERDLFLQLMFTPESRALRHLFFAERAASKIPDVPANTPLRAIESVAVIGAGMMGGGIAMNFLNAGVPVKLLETKQEALERGVATIRKNYEGQLAKGKLTQDKYAQRMALLSTTLDYADLKDADLVIEAVFEDMAVKQAVFTQLDAVAKPGAILASNTSTLDLNQIAAFTQRPQDVVGLHFFSPANVMKLLEVVRGAKTANDVLATAMAVAKKIRKTAVLSGVCDGFIGNRMLDPYMRQAAFLVDEGASPAQVDKAMERFGMNMGPFRMNDLVGLDVTAFIRKSQRDLYPGKYYSPVTDAICDMGRLGQKNGKGWYDYAPGARAPLPSKEVLAMIDAQRKALGITPRKISDAEIVERLVYALVNEGARILQDGIAERASDLDVVYLTGYGFPAQRGGPMQYADEVGLFNVVQSMNKFAANPYGDPAFWQPAALLADLAAKGGKFNA